jgi:hypothetical protein
MSGCPSKPTPTAPTKATTSPRLRGSSRVWTSVGRGRP